MQAYYHTTSPEEDGLIATVLDSCEARVVECEYEVAQYKTACSAAGAAVPPASAGLQVLPEAALLSLSLPRLPIGRVMTILCCRSSPDGTERRRCWWTASRRCSGSATRRRTSSS